MARSNITGGSQDIVQDDGAVLISIVQGEQIEWQIDLNFIEIVTPSYIFEAVIIEGANDGAGSEPIGAEPAGIEDTLVTRIPTDNGSWGAGNTYAYGDYVFNVTDSLYYYCFGNPTIGLSPELDLSNWEVFERNRVFIQFGATLSTGYAVQPGVNNPVYGFFELRVTEPANPIYTRTWKPTRGLVEFRYSPTELVV